MSVHRYGRDLGAYPTKAFFDAYVNTALWYSKDHSYGIPLRFNSRTDITTKTLAQMRSDCAKFQRACEDDIRLVEMSDEQAGHDFWLTRNREGNGFWARRRRFESETEDAFERLTDAAHAFGAYNLYYPVNKKDGKIHGRSG